MAEPFTRRCGLAGHESDHRNLKSAFPDVSGQLFLGGSPDFPQGQNRSGSAVLPDTLAQVDEVLTDEGVPADAGAYGLTDTGFGEPDNA